MDFILFIVLVGFIVAVSNELKMKVSKSQLRANYSQPVASTLRHKDSDSRYYDSPPSYCYSATGTSAGATDGGGGGGGE